MKLFLEVDIDNVENLQEVIELIDVEFVNDNGDSDGWLATALYNPSNDTMPEIKGFNVYTNIDGKLINALMGKTYEENSKMGN